MTIQEAYNKGLDDAEDAIIKQLASLIRDNKFEGFQNPKMQVLIDALAEWGDYFHTKSEFLTMVGKKYKKMLIRQREQLDNHQI